MISNQVLQNTIDGLKGITRIDLCVIDTEGKVLASTFPEADAYTGSVLAFIDSPADSQVIQGFQFFKIFDDTQLEYILLLNGGSEDAYMIGKLVVFQIQNLLVAYKERFDKDNFIKNLLLDNLLLVDIYNRAKKLHIQTEVRRAVFIIETGREKDTASLENVRTLFGTKSHDFITAVDEKNIIVVKELADNEGYPELNRTARVICDLLNSEGDEHVHIKGLGNEVIAAHVHGHNDIHVIRRRGQKHHRHLRSAANFAAPMVAVIARQRNIQQHQLRIELREVLIDPVEVLRAPHGIAPLFQSRAHHPRNRPVVLHHKNPIQALPSRVHYSKSRRNGQGD